MSRIARRPQGASLGPRDLSLARGITAQDIAQALVCGQPGCRCGRREGKGWLTHCPAHDDAHPSLNVGDAEDGKLLVRCRAGCSQDAVIAALREQGLWPQGKTGRSSGSAATCHEVRDVHGGLVAVHERVDNASGKRFTWRRPNGNLGLGGRPVSALPLYGSEKLASLLAGAVVVVVEGEKAADALARRGVTAVASVTGAAGTPGLESLQALRPFRVLLWPDNDGEGRHHMRRIAEVLCHLGVADIRMVCWPDAPPKGDAADFLGDGAALQALLDAAGVYQPPPEDLALLLDDVRAFIRRYVVLSDTEADAVVLWTAHTWALDVAESTPYLAVTSAEKRSGKTRLLEALSLVAARPWMTGRVTAAILVRKVAAQKPTLLLDESDAAFRGEKEYAETLRAVLNAGYRRGGVVSLCVKSGAEFDLRDFPVYCPKAIAGIGRLPDTVADRAVSIVLKRRAPNEAVERFRWKEAEGQARPLRERLESWAATSVVPLQEARPDIPAELDDRAADSWELAIADAAGADWPERARKAALALSVGGGRDDDSLGVRLLRDIEAVFEERNTDRIASVELADALARMEEAPWGDLRGKPLDTRALARLLKPYGVKPHQVRFGEGTLKGYQSWDFADAWKRYVPRRSETSETGETEAPAEPDFEAQGVSGVSLVPLLGGIGEPVACPHRLPGEVEDRWAHGGGRSDAAVCRCCGFRVRADLWAGGLCPVCRDGRPARVGSGHLLRLALDLGAKLVENRDGR